MINFKWVSILLALMVLSLSLAGCGSSSNDTAATTAAQNTSASEQSGSTAPAMNEPVTIKFSTWCDPSAKDDVYAKFYNDAVAKIKTEFNITVETETLPWDQLDTKLVVSNAAGAPNDITMCSSQKIASLVNTGSLLALDDYVKKVYQQSDLDDFYPFEKSATTYAGDGKKYMFLQSIHSRGIYYNKNLVSTPPSNWEELVAISQRITDASKGIYGFAFYGTKSYGSVESSIGPMIWSLNGKISDNDGKAVFNSPESEEAIKFLSDLVNKYKVTPQYCITGDYEKEARPAFESGKIGMMVDGSFMAGEYMSNTEFGKAGMLGYAPIPGKNGPAPNFASGWAYGIPTKAKNPDAAWKFIEYMERPDVQIASCAGAGGTPTRKSAAQDKAFTTDIFKSIISNLDANGHPMDPLLHYQECLEALNLAYLKYTLDPTVDLKKVLNDQANAFNEKFYKN